MMRMKSSFFLKAALKSLLLTASSPIYFYYSLVPVSKYVDRAEWIARAQLDSGSFRFEKARHRVAQRVFRFE